MPGAQRAMRRAQRKCSCPSAPRHVRCYRTSRWMNAAAAHASAALKVRPILLQASRPGSGVSRRRAFVKQNG